MRTVSRRVLVATSRDLTNASDLTNALANASVRVRDRDLTSAIDSAIDFANDLASASNLASASAIARDLANAIARDLANDRAIDITSVRDLASAIDLARNLAREFELGSAIARNAQGQHGAERVAPLAGRLLAAAAHLLPAGDRARYAEEFRSELAEIAGARAGRRSQLVYAARQVASAWRLRADLRAPRARKAAPLSARRRACSGARAG